MKAKTRLFGEIEIEDEKLIIIENGMIGLPDMRKFALIFDEEKEDAPQIMWMQSMDEPEVAFPVMMPHTVEPDYNPTVNDELLEPLGTLTEDNTYVLVTVTAPKNIEDLAINLKAPIIINTDTRKGCQIIIEDEYPVKYKIYDKLQNKAGE